MSKQIFVIIPMLAIVLLLVTCQQQKVTDDKTSALPSKFARPLTDTQFVSTSARLQRGEYLANGILRCFHCHAMVDTTQPGWPPLAGMPGAGRIFFEKDSTRLVAPNITPDMETGAGSWTDDMLLRAIKDGIGHDGRALNAMPWWTFRQMADEDIASVIVYLRSLPPVKNVLPSRLLPKAFELGLQKEKRPMTDYPVPFPDTNTLVNKGKYLVTIGECEGCHTAWYKRNPGYFAGGNPIANDNTDSVIVSANISPAITGIGGWDDETFIRVIRTGKAGLLHHSMPWIAYRHVSDDDLKAILAALKTLAPVEHHIVNGMKPTLCSLCGEMHGYGDQNKVTPIKTVRVDESNFPGYAGTYADKTDYKAIITFKNKKLFLRFDEEGLPELELIPLGKNVFTASGLPSPIHFLLDENGRPKSFVDEDLTPVTFTRK